MHFIQCRSQLFKSGEASKASDARPALNFPDSCKLANSVCFIVALHYVKVTMTSRQNGVSTVVRWLLQSTTYTAWTATMLEWLKVFTQTGLEDKKWGSYGRPRRPYGSGNVIEFGG